MLGAVGLYTDRILPRLTDLALRGPEIDRLRARAASGLAGGVLEVGFGGGPNLPRYPPAVTRVLAVEPSPGARRLAARRIAAARVPVELVGLVGEELPLPDASVDHVLSTWTMCTIPDVDRALAEVVRVLRPGGTLRFLEHGRSPDPAVARWQDRLTPIQRRVAGGCHLNRRIDEIVRRSGLRVEQLDNFHIRVPRPFGYMYEGVATRV